MLFTVNFNLHGNPVPSSVSAIYTPAMQEIAQIETCVKPHGGKVNHAGTHHYSVCVASDQLVEISTSQLTVSRRLYLTEGHERLLDTDDTGGTLGSTSETNRRCKPTWVSISPDDRNLYVACNGRSEVLEIDAVTLEIARRFQTGNGPYNLDVSPNGQYLVTSLKGDQAIAIFDLNTGVETRIDSSQPITHGVVITPDSRYALISNEAIGSTRGTIDVIDLASRELVATVEVQHQPGGISFWRMQEYTAHEALP
jgi:DNA-binding beta-propeller fold protein YncE